jgi:hypothetical protein
MLSERVENYLVKCIVGPSYDKDEENLKAMKQQVRTGVYDDFECFMYV